MRIAIRLSRTNDLGESFVATLLVRNGRLCEGLLPTFFSKLSLLPQFQKVPEWCYTWVVLVEYPELTRCRPQLVSPLSTLLDRREFPGL